MLHGKEAEAEFERWKQHQFKPGIHPYQKGERKMYRFWVIITGLCFVLALIILAGCSAGVRNLGYHEFANGTKVYYVQATTEGHDKPQITVVQSFAERPDGMMAKVGEWAAAGKSILSELSQSALTAGSSVGAAYLFGHSIKPHKYTNNETTTIDNGNSIDQQASQQASQQQEQQQGQQQGQRSSSSAASRSNSRSNSGAGVNSEYSVDVEVDVENNSNGGSGGSHPGCEPSGHC
jgi:hypothetical protein